MSKRASVDDSDSEVEVVNPSPNKKARKVTIEEEDDVPMIASEPEAEGQADEDDAEYEAENEERIRAEIQSQAKNKETGEVAEMGVIRKVELVNFMCHDFLEVNFGPQINFLTGHNGSGKSAILTAITVALGAKASITGRGAGIRAFIKNGKDACRVTVTLKNQGFEAYHHDIYGDHIIVERLVYREGGAGGYKIKSEKTGKIVSTKREELDKILDHMNIQVDNPINVLSQDAARAFLTKSNAKAKYDFFLQGTQLAQLSEEYDLVQTQIEVISNSLAQKETVLPEMRDVIKEAKKKVDDIAAVGKAEEKLLQLEHQLAWCYVCGKEEETKRKATEVEQSGDRLKQAMLFVKEGTNTQEDLEDQVTKLEALAGEHNNSIGPTKALVAETDAQIKKYKAEYRARESDRKELQAYVDQEQAEANGIEAAIRVEQAKLNIDTTEEKAKKLIAIRDLEAEIAKIKLQFPRLQQQIQSEQTERTRLVAEEEEARRQVETLQQEMQNLQGALQRLQHAQGAGPLAPYGQNMQAVVNEINRRKWVGRKPLGPLGLHVKLKDMKWKRLVEANLGNMMHSWAVTSGEDVRQLRDVFNQCRQRYKTSFYVNNPDVTVFRPDSSKGAEIDRADLTHKGFQTMLSLLHFEDPDVRDVIVDRANIERAPIKLTREEAVQLARTVGDGINVFSLDPLYKVFTRQGTQAQNYLEKWSKIGLFVDDRSAEIEELKDEMRAKEAEWQQAKQKRDALAQELQDINAKIREIEINKIQRLQRALVQRERGLADAIEANREEAPPNIAAMEERLEGKQRALEISRGQVADMDADLRQLQDENRPLGTERDRLKKELEEHAGVTRKYAGDITALQRKLTKAKSDKAHYAKKQAEEEDKLEILQSDLKTLEKEVEDWTAEVIKVHPQRVDVPHGQTAETLDHQIKAQQKIVNKQVQSSGTTMEEAQASFDRAKKAYDSAKKEVAEMKSLHSALKAALNLRSIKWHTFRRFIALRAKVTFQEHLSVRGFLGKIIFEHERGTLNLRIQTDDLASTQDASSREKDPKQLSGGEKSFSTCALLLALWDAVGCPIRCLDEFDVFMDAVVRRQTLNMMMEVAQKSDSTQYVLITPQDMSGVRTGPAVRIHKMRDPERLDNQTRLNFAGPSEPL